MRSLLGYKRISNDSKSIEQVLARGHSSSTKNDNLAASTGTTTRAIYYFLLPLLLRLLLMLVTLRQHDRAINMRTLHYFHIEAVYCSSGARYSPQSLENGPDQGTATLELATPDYTHTHTESRNVTSYSRNPKSKLSRVASPAKAKETPTAIASLALYPSR